MAIVSKIIPPASLTPMLNAIFNPSGTTQKFEVYTTVDSPQIKRGESSDGDLYATAGTISGGASVALNGNVVINVVASSTGANAITEIRCVNIGDNTLVLYYITVSPAEEFLYAGTITITSATITISNVMT